MAVSGRRARETANISTVEPKFHQGRRPSRMDLQRWLSHGLDLAKTFATPARFSP
jgi:transposase